MKERILIAEDDENISNELGDASYARLSCATSAENIVEGLDRIERFISKLS